MSGMENVCSIEFRQKKSPGDRVNGGPEARPTQGVDVANRNRVTPMHVLYRFYSAKGTLLYVGITKDPESRFRNHRGDKPWWTNVADIKMERFKTRGELSAAEIKAIQTEKPKYNKAYAVVSQPDQLNVPERTKPPWGNDANRFGTSPDTRTYATERRERAVLPCPECRGYAVYRVIDESGVPTDDDLVHCPGCRREWTHDEWHDLVGFGGGALREALKASKGEAS